MKTLIAIAAALAVLSPCIVNATPAPLVVTPLAQPLRIAPMILSPSAALAAVSQVYASGTAVSLSGTLYRVYVPVAQFITTGTNAGMVRMQLMVSGSTPVLIP
jgi:hypothetical protein